MAPELSAVILAAGYSSRMGACKALLPLGSRTVLGQCIALCMQCGIDDVIVVTGHEAETIEPVARQAGAWVVRNADFASGMYSSIRTGIGHLPEGCLAFLLLPMDIPLVRHGTLRLLLRAFACEPGLILHPVFAGERGHPPLIAREVALAIQAQPEIPGGLRAVLARVEAEQPERVREVRVADANILFDMDTPAAFAEGVLRCSRRGFPSRDECAAILDHIHPMPEKGVAHGRQVGRIAVSLCEAIRRRRGRELEADLCWASGLLHDLAKGHPQHELEGGRWLSDLGFERAAEIVAAHKDLVWQAGMAITEKELVHLADKMVRGSRVVSIAERFEDKLRLYRHDPEAVRAVRDRYDLALLLGAAIEQEAGCPLAALVAM